MGVCICIPAVGCRYADPDQCELVRESPSSQLDLLITWCYRTFNARHRHATCVPSRETVEQILEKQGIRKRDRTCETDVSGYPVSSGFVMTCRAKDVAHATRQNVARRRYQQRNAIWEEMAEGWDIEVSVAGSEFMNGG